MVLKYGDHFINCFATHPLAFLGGCQAQAPGSPKGAAWIRPCAQEVLCLERARALPPRQLLPSEAVWTSPWEVPQLRAHCLRIWGAAKPMLARLNTVTEKAWFLPCETQVISPWVLLQLEFPFSSSLFSQGGAGKGKWGRCGWGRGSSGLSGRYRHWWAVHWECGIEGGWCFSSALGSVSYRLSHAIKPWGQKKLRENWRKFMYIFYKLRYKNIPLC